MSIEETMQGKWCLLVEEEPYSTEGRTLIEFRDGSLIDADGVENPYRIEGNTLVAPLADQVTLTVNPPDVETATLPLDLPAETARAQAIVTTSFGDGSDDLVEYAVLVREV